MLSDKLEIGPGDVKLGEGWCTVSAEPGPSVDYVTEWGHKILPFPDNVFSLVYASHVLEHVPWFYTLDALREAWRVLKPQGVLEVWVPDLAYLFENYQSQTCGDDWRKHNPDGDFMLWLNGRLYTYGGSDHNWHRAVFDEPYLRRCMGDIGFASITRLNHPRGYDHGPINLGLAGVKP